MENFDVAIIGGGAAGLSCAVTLAESGNKIKICVIDAGDRLGKKLAATGNGQGNISNADMTASHYFGGNVPLVERIACRDAYAGEKLFNCLFTEDERGRIYPAGRQASALSDCLIKKLSTHGTEIIFSSVVDVEKDFILTLSDGRKLSAEYVVMCVGGKAQRQFKTDGTSYKLAEKFGHRVTELLPSLVQLKTETAHIKKLKGIRADCAVTAIIGGQAVKKVRGDVIFTDYGVSGNAIFSISPYVTGKKNAEISIEFLPDFSKEQVESDVRAKKKLGYADSELLSGSLHNQIGRAVIKRANSSDAEIIAATLKNFVLPVLGTLGFDYAQVTRGGVDMRDVSDELESKFQPKLFFAGEVLDVDGDCGGYNLHWAFTSGMAVAHAILKRK